MPPTQGWEVVFRSILTARAKIWCLGRGSSTVLIPNFIREYRGWHERFWHIVRSNFYIWSKAQLGRVQELVWRVRSVDEPRPTHQIFAPEVSIDRKTTSQPWVGGIRPALHRARPIDPLTGGRGSASYKSKAQVSPGLATRIKRNCLT